jgi:hypothetical protein
LLRPRPCYLLICIGAVAVCLLLVAAAPGAVSNVPSINVDITGQKGSNGWYVGDARVEWTVEGETDSQGCDTRTLRVDTEGTVITCRATDDGFNWIQAEVTIKLDKTVPEVVAPIPSRAPDRSGWYNHEVRFDFEGDDATSGISSCSPVTYGGPDSATAVVEGRCTDNAGNGASAVFPLKYDKTAPSVRAVPGRRPDVYGWYGHDLRISFVGADAMSGIAWGSCTRKVYSGPNRAAASVHGGCTDRAGNTAFRTFKFRYQEPLLSPRNGRRAWRPLLNWVSVPRARYYNVQVWKNGRRILSRWPKYSRLQMPRTWVHEGLRYWMSTPGRYDWYVWPRFHRGYGEMVGHRYFVRP